MTNVVDLSEFRRTRKIAPPIRMYSDADIARAREIERALAGIEDEERFNRAVSTFYGSGYAGERPADTEEAS